MGSNAAELEAETARGMGKQCTDGTLLRSNYLLIQPRKNQHEEDAEQLKYNTALIQPQINIPNKYCISGVMVYTYHP